MNGKIWVVSWYNYGESPVVTAFNNYNAANEYYNYEANRNHVKVDIDECELYSIFDEAVD